MPAGWRSAASPRRATQVCPATHGVPHPVRDCALLVALRAVVALSLHADFDARLHVAIGPSIPPPSSNSFPISRYLLEHAPSLLFSLAQFFPVLRASQPVKERSNMGANLVTRMQSTYGAD